MMAEDLIKMKLIDAHKDLDNLKKLINYNDDSGHKYYDDYDEGYNGEYNEHDCDYNKDYIDTNAYIPASSPSTYQLNNNDYHHKSSIDKCFKCYSPSLSSNIRSSSTGPSYDFLHRHNHDIPTSSSVGRSHSCHQAQPLNTHITLRTSYHHRPYEATAFLKPLPLFRDHHGYVPDRPLDKYLFEPGRILDEYHWYTPIPAPRVNLRVNEYDHHISDIVRCPRPFIDKPRTHFLEDYSYIPDLKRDVMALDLAGKTSDYDRELINKMIVKRSSSASRVDDLRPHSPPISQSSSSLHHSLSTHQLHHLPISLPHPYHLPRKTTRYNVLDDDEEEEADDKKVIVSGLPLRNYHHQRHYFSHLLSSLPPPEPHHHHHYHQHHHHYHLHYPASTSPQNHLPPPHPPPSITTASYLSLNKFSPYFRQPLVFPASPVQTCISTFPSYTKPNLKYDYSDNIYMNRSHINDTINYDTINYTGSNINLDAEAHDGLYKSATWTKYDEDDEDEVSSSYHPHQHQLYQHQLDELHQHHQPPEHYQTHQYKHRLIKPQSDKFNYYKQLYRRHLPSLDVHSHKYDQAYNDTYKDVYSRYNQNTQPSSNITYNGPSYNTTFDDGYFYSDNNDVIITPPTRVTKPATYMKRTARNKPVFVSQHTFDQ